MQRNQDPKGVLVVPGLLEKQSWTFTLLDVQALGYVSGDCCKQLSPQNTGTKFSIQLMQIPVKRQEDFIRKVLGSNPIDSISIKVYMYNHLVYYNYIICLRCICSKCIPNLN